MSILVDFTQTENLPNNEHRHIHIEDVVGTINIGGTDTHQFIIPYVVSEGDLKQLLIVYKQGLDTILKIKDDFSTTTYESAQIISYDEETCQGKTIITVKLGVADTRKFRKTVLDCYVQLAVIESTNNVIYFRPGRIKVIEPLDQFDILTNN